jgi:hypothetical protein
MAKINGIFNNIITKTQNGKYIIEIGNNFILGKRYGHGKSLFVFVNYSFSFNIHSPQSFIYFLKRLEKEVIKYENESR